MASNSLHKRVANLTSNSAAVSKLKSYSLNINNVAWEDTSRYAGSSWGSNISDLTLKVGDTRFPLIRSNNFTDTTVDMTLDKLPKLVVGNEAGKGLTTVTLEEYLTNFQKYCNTDGKDMNFFHSRDQHVLTSAQACVLPIDSGKVEFAVDLYNYQSGSEPAVLVVMATSYGTSAQVVCGGNSVLYFNDNQISRLFKAERLTDYRVSQGRSTDGPMTSEEKALNGIYIFQIPLKQKPVSRSAYACFSANAKGSYKNNEECCFATEKPKSCDDDMDRTFDLFDSRSAKGMERAILSLGEEKGPYKGIRDSNRTIYKMERDTERPIRLTVQFYMCTDSGDLVDANVQEIANQIRTIYEQGLHEGSLVVPDAVSPKPGVLLPTRPTATKFVPPPTEHVVTPGLL